MPSRAVVFDLDDTLIVEEPVARGSLRTAARLLPGVDAGLVEEVVLACARRVWRGGPQHGLCRELGIGSWEALWATFEGCHPRLAGVREWIPSYHRETWCAALAGLGVDDPALAPAMAEAYVEAQRVGHHLIEGAAEALQTLRGRVRLGLLTNGPADIQRWKLTRAGLAGCFDAVISGEAGVGKPAPEAFARVLDALGVRAADSVMAGEHLPRDIEGALGAGLAAVWVAGQRTRPEPRPGVRVIASVAELAEPEALREPLAQADRPAA